MDMRVEELAFGSEIIKFPNIYIYIFLNEGKNFGFAGFAAASIVSCSECFWGSLRWKLCNIVWPKDFCNL
ncbi:MAG: hypothetical protein CL943_04065 [Candidatus Diapherotrites archaeon]|uniref:Uncharacterized protein n=1 Tax=Candidatus Iainarchaeum sp. TaxID=3101447 RepID=A0A2D6M211_9ARCH|nr:hypothetical protein [Candidatus Diapherotrites archaeon]|tara:strand:- start:5571 stop:5780 length:210 start_codon:yes stop_codon:yes gene_type:complete